LRHFVVLTAGQESKTKSELELNVNFALGSERTIEMMEESLLVPRCM